MDDDQLKNQDIIDGEEVTEIPAGNPDQANAQFNLEELIKNYIETIGKLKNEIKDTREMFEDSFSNNPTYREASDKLKDVSKARNSIRQQIAKQPSVATIAQKVKDLRFDVNEQTKTLSDLLKDYHEQTGATQIETRDGQIMEIVSTAKLVRKSKFNP